MMTADKPATKSERALQLHERGLTPAQIAERIGSNPSSISSMITHAKNRRAKKEAAQQFDGVRG